MSSSYTQSTAPTTSLNPNTGDASYGRWLQGYVRLLLLAAKLQPSLLAVIFEIIENALDAALEDDKGNKMPVDVVLSVNADSIDISDNGHGMVPFVLKDDWEMLEEYWQALADKTLGSNDNIRQLISLLSRQSLEWLALSAAFSGKTPMMNQRGRLGVGAQGFRQMARKALWRTRPHLSLAVSYWGEGTREAEVPPVYTFTAPILPDDLDVNDNVYVDIDPRIERALDPPQLMDALGNELAHGTHVHLSDIKPGVLAGIRWHDLPEQLGERFSESLRSGKLRLTVVDRYTEQGRRTEGGKQFPIVHTDYSGVLVYSETITYKGMPIEAHLWYDRAAKGLHVKLRRGDQEMVLDMDSPLLGEFKGSSLSSGKLNGWISCPNSPVISWDANKQVPSVGEARSTWAQGVLDVILAQTDQNIENIEDNARQERATKAANAVFAKVTERVLGFKDFQGLQIGNKKPGGKTPKPSRPPKIQETVFVDVVDENDDGVAGATIKLVRTKNRQEVLKVTTGSSGEISLGKVHQNHGLDRYRVEVVLPEGVVLNTKLTPDLKQVVNLTLARPGERVHFHVITGRDPRPVTKLPTLRPAVHPFEGATFNQLWDGSRIEFGIVEINSAHPEYQRALDSKGDEPFSRLLTTCVVSALSAYQFRNGTPEEALQAATRTLAALL